MKKHTLFVLIAIFILVASACKSQPAGQAETTQLAVPEATSAPPVETVAQAGGTASPQPATATPGSVSQAKQLGSFFAIHEIGLGPEGYVSLTNFTGVPTNTEGLFLCQGEDCFSLPEAVIQPGETARVAVGAGEGLENVIAANATIGALKPSNGEVALFASDKFDDPKALLVYLQWGSTPHALTDLAVEAGLWIKTGYAPTSPKATRLYRVEESGLWLFEE